MKIEISPKEYWKKLTWYDGHLYCSLLNIDGKDDWKLPSPDEMCDKRFGLQWYREDGDKPGYYKLSDLYWVIPVRDAC